MLSLTTHFAEDICCVWIESQRTISVTEDILVLLVSTSEENKVMLWYRHKLSREGTKDQMTKKGTLDVHAYTHKTHFSDDGLFVPPLFFRSLFW